MKRYNGMLTQNCDVYISYKISNAHWDLPRSEWANPYYKQGDSLEKYEQHVRQKLWHKLDSLEGKLLGCWCEDEQRCHGSVLVTLLEEKKTKQINQNLTKAGLRVDSSHLTQIRRAYDWAKDPRFLAYATRLDRTNVFYFQPAVYEAVEHIWGVPGPKRWPAYTNDDNIYWVVGLYNGLQSLGSF